MIFINIDFYSLKCAVILYVGLKIASGFLLKIKKILLLIIKDLNNIIQIQKILSNFHHQFRHPLKVFTTSLHCLSEKPKLPPKPYTNKRSYCISKVQEIICLCWTHKKCVSLYGWNDKTQHCCFGCPCVSLQGNLEGLGDKFENCCQLNASYLGGYQNYFLVLSAKFNKNSPPGSENSKGCNL